MHFPGHGSILLGVGCAHHAGQRPSRGAERRQEHHAGRSRPGDRATRTLHHWCKLMAEQGEQAFPGSGHQTAQEEELRRLKHELEVVRQERDILKPSVQ